uniref:Alpha/beta hydrolase fold-3 domain-containing protein n=1 Tax=Varanus komodoensis TaxID=61221 RepID=A0A8D2LNU6_VARKO
IVLEKLRLYNRLSFSRLVLKGLPTCKDSSLSIQDQKFDEVPVRIYQSKETYTTKRKAFLFFHGGAGTHGTLGKNTLLASYGIPCKLATNLVALKNPYPNQFYECLNATFHLMKHVDDYHIDASRIILSGDSCGANFATRICQVLAGREDLPKIHAQVLIYPALQGMDFDLPSYQQNARAPLMWREMVPYFCCLFLNKQPSLTTNILEGQHVPEEMRQKYRKWVSGDLVPEEFKVRGYKPRDPASYTFKPEVYEEMKTILDVMFSPLFAEDDVIQKLPQTCILTCEYDVLRDDGLLYKKRLEDNGVPVNWIHIENGLHTSAVTFGYGLLTLPSAKRIVQDIAEVVKNL